jgi:hypothetical protein
MRYPENRLVAIARGEQEYFDPNGIATATEACKSNALMRCCKDLGIASELWYVLMFFVIQVHSYNDDSTGIPASFVNLKPNIVLKYLWSTSRPRRSLSRNFVRRSATNVVLV